MRSAVIAVATAALLATPAGAAGSSAPELIRATVGPKHHVVVAAELPDGSTPRLVEVSRTPRLLGTFGFPAGGLALREPIDGAPSASGMLHVVTHGRLPPGRYWVAISVEEADTTSCIPLRSRGSSGCLAEWSNVLPLTVP